MNRVNKNRRFSQRSCEDRISMDVAESDWLGMKAQVWYKEPCHTVFASCPIGAGDLEEKHYKHTSSTDITITTKSSLADLYKLHVTCYGTT